MKRDLKNQKEDLLNEIQNVLKDVDSLYDEGSKLGADEVQRLRAKLQDRLNVAQDKLQGLEERAMEQVRHHAKVADDYVNEKPYYAMGFAALAGLVVGVLLNRS